MQLAGCYVVIVQLLVHRSRNTELSSRSSELGSSFPFGAHFSDPCLGTLPGTRRSGTCVSFLMTVFTGCHSRRCRRRSHSVALLASGNRGMVGRTDPGARTHLVARTALRAGRHPASTPRRGLKARIRRPGVTPLGRPTRALTLPALTAPCEVHGYRAAFLFVGKHSAGTSV